MSPTPPRAPKRSFVHQEHGRERPDPWHWLKDRADPATIAHLHAENAYTEQACAHLEPARRALYDELLGRIQEDDRSVPVRIGQAWYYRRTEEGRAYALHCRRQGSLEAAEEILVDENDLAESSDYFRLEQLEISRDQRFVAWLQDLDGGERFTLHLRDLESGQTRQVATELKWSLAWSADGSCLFATRADAAQRPYQVWRFPLDAGEPTLVFEEPDERAFVQVSRTRDWRYILVSSSSKTTSEVHLIDASQPAEPARCVWPRVQGVLYDLVHHRGTLYIRTNDQGDNFRVVAVPADAPQGEVEVVRSHDPDVYITGIQGFSEHLVLWERRDSVPALTVRTLTSGAEHQVDFPEPSFHIAPEENPDFDTHELRLTYTSPRTPSTVLVYDMHDHERAVLKVQPVIGYDPRGYEIELLYADAADGERIPITLLRRRDQTPDNGPHPLLLSGYGSYGLSYPATFRSTRFSLVDRGVIVAFAHIRGGSERGRAWYEAGKLEHKRNTFTDFIAAAEHLQGTGWTAADRMAIQGGSAGGLLVGAVLNSRPELVAGVIAHVPFVDALNTMLDATLPLTVTEYEEWGDPRQPEVFERLLSYAPYDNVRDAPYPPTFVTAGLNDPRVGYWEPAKWVQALREHSTAEHPILFRVHMGAGHGGQSGRYGRLDDLSWEYSFLLEHLGIDPPSPKS